MRAFAGAASAIATMAALLAGAAAPSQTIVDSWGSLKMPAAPPLERVTVDPAHTALLVLDMSAANCVEAKRPSCVRSLPKVRGLLDRARAAHMLVVYGAGISTPGVEPVQAAAIAPQAGEPLVRAPVDKFLGSGLDKLLADHQIKAVIVTGTSAEGAVLYTASGAALRGIEAIVPLDGYSAVDPFAEAYTAWHLKNAPVAISSKVKLSRSDLIVIP